MSYLCTFQHLQRKERLEHRVQRRCVCRWNITTRRKPLKKWVILIALQFRYTFYRPQPKRLRARKIGLQYNVPKSAQKYKRNVLMPPGYPVILLKSS